MNNAQALIDQILRSIEYLINRALMHTTKCYDGMVEDEGINGKWQVRFNGDLKELPLYGSGTPVKNKTVKVIVPQGNLNLAFFFL